MEGQEYKVREYVESNNLLKSRLTVTQEEVGVLKSQNS